MKYIKIGTIINTHGIRGEVKIMSCSDFDEERYAEGAQVFVEKDGSFLPLTVKSYRVHKGFPLVSFQEWKDINDAEQYKTCGLFVPEESRPPLTDGRHYISDLIGMSVVDEEGRMIGTVRDLEDTRGAQRNMRVAREGMKDALIPYVPAFILRVDDRNREITVRVIEGLL